MHQHNDASLLLIKRPKSAPAAKLSRSVTYTFYSLFSPSSITNLGLYLNNYVTSNISSNNEANYRSKKILVKQSYLILAWLNAHSRKNDQKARLHGFAFLPRKRTKFTMTKAPMAHKTFSQEQFVIQYRRLIVRLVISKPEPLCLHSTMLSVSNFHLRKMSLGTNLLFLSKVSYSLPSKVSNFIKLG